MVCVLLLDVYTFLVYNSPILRYTRITYAYIYTWFSQACQGHFLIFQRIKHLCEWCGMVCYDLNHFLDHAKHFRSELF